MPKYDYRCSAGHVYEKREGFDAPPVQQCQQCNAEARRVLTAPAIVFKGSGWYVNDSRKNGPSSTDLPATSSTSESSTSESKPVASSDSTSSSSSSTPPAAAAAD